MPFHPIGPEGSAGHQPETPTIGSASASDSSASVPFTAPNYLGKPIGTTYTATSTPGSITATGSSSPISVSGLSNGTSYTFKVKLGNSIVDSLESAASNSVTPTAPAPPPFPPPFAPPPPFPPPFQPAPPPFPPPFAPPYFPGFGVYSEYSISSSTGIITINGRKDAKDIVVGDVLVAMDLDTNNVSDWTTWSKEDLSLNETNLRETEVVSITSRPISTLYIINGDAYSGTHYILTKKDDVVKFIKTSEIDDSYFVYSFADLQFVPIEVFDIIEYEDTVYSINCEPYDNFFTENMLVFDVRDNI